MFSKEDMLKDDHNDDIGLILNQIRYLTTFTNEQRKEFIDMGSGPINKRERLTSDMYIQEMSIKKQDIINEMLNIMKSAALDCELNKLMNEEVKCLKLPDTDEISYYPNIRMDLGKTITAERVGKNKMKGKGKKGILLKNGMVIFPDKNKKGYLIFKMDKYQKYEANISAKDINKKIIFSRNTKTIFDFNKFTRNKELLDLGQISVNGKVI